MNHNAGIPIQLENLSKRYQGQWVIKDLHLKINGGELLVLVGPSGCGKSTLLRMLAGLEIPDEGRILVGGEDITRMPPQRRDIAMVFQNYALYPHLSIKDNMSLSLRLKGHDQQHITAKVEQAASMLGILDLLERKPRQLSGGQRQRVAMGRAVVRNPRAFLFDEPLSNLDAELRQAMRCEIKELHQSLRNTMVYVTHDQVEAMTLADRLVLLRRGQIEQVGAPIEVFNYPANVFVAGFIGTPPMNLLPGLMIQGAVHLGRTLGNNELEASVVVPMPTGVPAQRVGEGAEVLCGVRPQHLCILPKDAEASASLSARWARLKMVVTVIEPLGAEMLVHGRFAGQKLSVVTPYSSQPRTGDVLTLGFAPDNLHVFCATSGSNLKTKQRQGAERQPEASPGLASLPAMDTSVPSAPATL